LILQGRSVLRPFLFLMAKISTRERGNTGEDAAAQFLENRGYRIVTRNWKPPREEGAPRGELDIVAWHGEVLCFIEVKALRESSTYVSSTQFDDARQPQHNVTPAKQRQISRLALFYLSLHGFSDETRCRFDVVEVWLRANTGHMSTHNATCALHQSAFEFRE
jgi:putative endonuclease